MLMCFSRNFPIEASRAHRSLVSMGMFRRGADGLRRRNAVAGPRRTCVENLQPRRLARDLHQFKTTPRFRPAS
jgi:hypothetical protein